jgi:arylsulfatase A-like enzyme
VTETVSLVDVAPTILGALGITPPTGTDGIDLAPSWRQPGVRGLPARPVFTETDGNEGGNAETIPVVSLRAVRDGPLKLIDDRTREQMALFDLVVDPGEQTNIAGERPEAVRSLRQRLQEHMTSETAQQVP